MENTWNGYTAGTRRMLLEVVERDGHEIMVDQYNGRFIVYTPGAYLRSISVDGDRVDAAIELIARLKREYLGRCRAAGHAAAPDADLVEQIREFEQAS